MRRSYTTDRLRCSEFTQHVVPMLSRKQIPMFLLQTPQSCRASTRRAMLPRSGLQYYTSYPVVVRTAKGCAFVFVDALVKGRAEFERLFLPIVDNISA
jgi:hypothetical protein